MRRGESAGLPERSVGDEGRRLGGATWARSRACPEIFSGRAKPTNASTKTGRDMGSAADQSNRVDWAVTFFPFCCQAPAAGDKEIATLFSKKKEIATLFGCRVFLKYFEEYYGSIR
jgi:hypothetical protein